MATHWHPCFSGKCTTCGKQMYQAKTHSSKDSMDPKWAGIWWHSCFFFKSWCSWAVELVLFQHYPFVRLLNHNFLWIPILATELRVSSRTCKFIWECLSVLVLHGINNSIPRVPGKSETAFLVAFGQKIHLAMNLVSEFCRSCSRCLKSPK